MGAIAARACYEYNIGIFEQRADGDGLSQLIKDGC